MSSSCKFALILMPFVIHASASAESLEIIRRQGFAEHQSGLKMFEKARESGEQTYYEEQQIWELARERDLRDYKTRSKARTMDDDGPEAKLDAKDKKAFEEEYEKNRKTYVQKEKSDALVLENKLQKLATEEEEYGLTEQRPRYEYKKRPMFGGKPNFKKGSGASSGGGSGGGGYRPTPSTGDFPPPPSFDDFSNESFPPPVDDFGGDMAPPVPVPSFEDDGNFNENDFPPPPPPPPPFEGEGGDFGGDF